MGRWSDLTSTSAEGCGRGTSASVAAPCRTLLPSTATRGPDGTKREPVRAGSVRLRGYSLATRNPLCWVAVVGLVHTTAALIVGNGSPGPRPSLNLVQLVVLTLS